MILSLLGCVGQKASRDRRFWLRANKPFNELSVLEDEHGGNTLNLELSSSARVFIDIQLGHTVTTARLRSELIHNRTNHAAGSAPGRPAIEQDCPVAFQHLALKSCIGNYQRFSFLSNFFCLAHIEWCTTLATPRDLFGGMVRVNAILSATVATNHYRHYVPRLEKF